MEIEQDGIVYYLGKYRGRVSDVDDPDKSYRVKLVVPDISDTDETDWALPSFPGGSFLPPNKGDQVWLEFERGDPDFPVYTGYIPSSFAGAQPAPGASVGVADDTTALLTGKGGAAVEISDEENETRKIYSPASTSQTTYPLVRRIQAGRNFIEVDSTPDGERVQAYHATGSFWEFGDSGQFSKDVRASENDWVRGSRTIVTLGRKTEIVSGNVQFEYKTSVQSKIVKNYKVEVGGDTERIYSGSVKETINGGRAVEVAGIDQRIASSVKDTATGGRSIGTLGNQDEIISGALSIMVANSDFVTGQLLGYNLIVAQGAVSLTAAAGDMLLTATGGNMVVTGATSVAVSTLGTMLLTSATTLDLVATTSIGMTAPLVLLGAPTATQAAVLGPLLDILWAAMHAWVAAHTHIGNLGAPTGPPVPPPAFAPSIAAAYSKQVLIMS